EVQHGQVVGRGHEEVRYREREQERVELALAESLQLARGIEAERAHHQQGGADQDDLEEDAQRIEGEHAAEEAGGLSLERPPHHQRRGQGADGEDPVHGVAAAHTRGVHEHDQEHAAREDDLGPEALQAGGQGVHAQPRRKSASSRFGVRRRRYMVSTMARATATSAAAITITKIAKSWPCRLPGPKRAKATRLTFAEFRISSMPISTFTALRRVRTPSMPRENRAAETTR